MIKFGRFVLSGMIAVSVVAAAGSVTYAKTGDNSIKANVATFKDMHYGNYARYDMMPGYTQVTGVREGYYRSYKWARYAEAGETNNHKYKIYDEKKGGSGIQYLYTPFHRVSDNTVRRYNEGYINKTQDAGSTKMEKYCRTVYKGE